LTNHYKQCMIKKVDSTKRGEIRWSAVLQFPE